MVCPECQECLGNALALSNTFYRAKKPEAKIPKLIQNDKNSAFYRGINKCFQMFYILAVQGRKILWFVSCIAFMYVIPISFEIFSEQQRILQKIQMQMMNDTMMDSEPPQMRPF